MKLQIVVENLDLVPEYKTSGSAGLDLSIKENVVLRKDSLQMAGTGVRVSIPKDHVGLVFIRSSIATRRRVYLANNVGVIDSDYRGEILLPLVYQGEDTYLYLERGTRVAQLIVLPYPRVQLAVVDELPSTERGEGGFGSTGER